MRFRLGLVIGFGTGYYFGAKAGRQRYEQLDRWISKARESEVVETAAEKAKQVVDHGVERAKDLVDRPDEDDVQGEAVDMPVSGNGATNSGLPTRPMGEPPGGGPGRG